MQNSPQTSFMPQQPLLRVEGGSQRKEAVNLALVLALIVFFVALAVSGGVFFWHKQVVARVLTHARQLEDAEKLLSIEEISNFKKIDTRIDNAKTLLQNHTVFSTVLRFIESATAQNIALTSLGYAKDANDLSLTIAGAGPSYEAVYFQGETWRAMKSVVKNVEITGVTLSRETGVVIFNAKISINPELAKYKKLFEDTNGSRTQGLQTSVAPSSEVTPKIP